MANQFVAPSFSLRLRGKGGRYVKGSQFSKAVSYELWLGRKVIDKDGFPRTRRYAADKRAFLKSLIERLVRKAQKEFEKRQRALERQRKARLRKKQETEKKEKRRLRKLRIARNKRKQAKERARKDAIHKAAKKPAKARAKKLIAREEEIREAFFPDQAEEEPLLDDIRVEKEDHMPEAVVIPIDTKDTDFTKEIIEKSVISKPSNLDGKLDLQILDFNLNNPVEVNDLNYSSQHRFLIAKFMGPVRDFWEATRKIGEALYIFRVKYQMQVGHKNGEPVFANQGVSSAGRFKSRDDFEYVMENVAEAFEFLGKSMDNYTARSVTNSLLITGFTLESVMVNHGGGIRGYR